MLKRMWVNQSSTLDPLHKYHGENVLFDIKDEVIYFTRGSIISMQVPCKPPVLSNGWLSK